MKFIETALRNCSLVRVSLAVITTLCVSGCAHRQNYHTSRVAPSECFGKQAVTLEKAKESVPSVAERIETQAHTTYDRAFFLRQAATDGTLVKSHESVPLKGVESATLLINMKRGDLLITGGGTQNLLDAEFEYTSVEPIPILSYQTRGTERIIEALGMGRDNSWKFNLSERIPIALRIESAGGAREMNFEDVPVTDFKLQSLSGSSILNFPGDHPYLNSLNIHQRQGSLGFAASGGYEHLQTVGLMTCCGDFSAKFTGMYPRLSKMELGSLNGDVDVDLTGCFQKICRIRITATCGNLKLKLPAGLGVSVKIHHSCASICAVGMHRVWSSDAWVNPAYGKTDVFLDIEVDSTCGQIDLILDACCCPPWVW